MPFVLLLFLYTKPTLAQYTGPKPTVTKCVYHDVSPPLMDIVPHPSLPKTGDLEETELPDVIEPPKAGALPIGEDPVWQKENGSKGTVIPYRNFEALRNSDNSSGVAPPDSDGDVGPNHYFAMVNNVFQIFNRAGTSLYGPAGNTTIWDGWGGYYGQSISDPIVLYDEQADRWFASVMTTSTYGGNYHILCAVSTSSSPTGTWYRYAWAFNSKADYPKYGIWPDGYYLGLNRTGDDVLVLERSAMLIGAAADMVSFDNPGKPVPNNTTFNCVLPSDCDGTFPAYGTPNYFWGIGDDAWAAYSTDRLLVWEFHVNWTTPASSTWTGPTAIATAAFDATFNAFGVGEIAQPGTAQLLDCIPWILMYRPQFRNFGSYYSLVCNHTVDVDATNHAGVRWYELRKTTGGWYIRQQNTYSPNGDSRFFGSVAMNAKGDIALGYSVSSSSTYPSIRFTGRLADDPLNSMTFTESNIWAGSNSQTDTRRWGDYSMMSVDPVNDHSFWYISEYAGNYGGWGDWITQVAAFTLDDYCAASSLYNVEYISNVNIGSINNTTGNEQYANYTNLSTNIHNSSTGALIVTAGNYYSGDDVRVWIDWNDDNDFSDADEYIGTDASVPFEFTIDPPVGVSLGEHRMRIRLSYTYGVDPCGVSNYGEVEDYTINITGVAGSWAGTVSSDWFNGANWDDGNVPTSTVSVNIPAGTPYSPVIGAGNAYCGSLYLQSGASLTQNTGSYFYCYGTFDAGFGTFTMNGLSYLYFTGSTNTVWWDDYQDDTYTYVRVDKTISTASMNMQTNMTCSGTFEVREGVFSMSSGRTLTVTGTGASAFEVEFGGKVILDDASKTITSAGNVHFMDGSQATLSAGTINCASSFVNDANTSYNIAFTGGTLIMNGASTQYINDLDGGTLDLDNLTIAKSGGVCYIQSANLDINDGLLISGGTLSCDNGPSPTATYNIYIAGNWTNNVGTTGFAESTGRVIFDGGNYHQYCSNETFNILEINKPSGGAFRMNGTNVVCAAYDWTAGGVDVLTGSFTANDLLDNAIAGAFYNNTGGTINLINSGAGLYVDLAGELHNFGGVINITGSISYWPYTHDAVVEMTSGIIDLKTCGLTISSSSNSLTTNITGGTIRTASYFSGSRADFTPTAGTLELYGTSDSYISQTNGCTVHDVVINKSTSDGANVQPVIFTEDERSGEIISDGGKANNISLNTNFTITGILDIDAGSLTLNGHQLDVTGNVSIYGQLVMTNALDIFNCDNSIKWYSGSTANVTSGEFNIGYYFQFYSGSNVQIGTGNTLNLIGSVETSIYSQSAGCEVGNVIVDMTSGTSYCHAGSTVPIYVAGDMTILSGNHFKIQSYDLIVDGNLNVQNGALIDMGSLFAAGYLEVNSDFTLNGELLVDNPSKDNSIKSNSTNDNANPEGAADNVVSTFANSDNTDWMPGEVYVHGHYTQASTAELSILGGGTFICDQPSTSIVSVAGIFNLNDGLFEITNNHISMTAASNINGGTIRCGGSFIAIFDGTFQPTGGLVEFIGSGSTGQYISLHANNYFHDLTINRTNLIQIYTGTDLNVKNDFTILSGGLNTNTRNMFVGGDWDNQFGTAAFIESIGKVSFNGPGTGMQFINSDETFNILENNTVQAIRINNNLVTCNSYDWTSGSISVSLGTFIANDLVDSGIYGDYYALTGSEIYLNQDGAQYVDLFSTNILIYGGGLIKVTGGADESFWCTSAPLSLGISTGGVLDFDGPGITIYNNYLLTEDITDGAIKTSGWFGCNRTDFNPVGGTFELYGGSDSRINVLAGSTFHDVLINKSGGDKSIVQLEDRDGSLIKSTKSNSAILYNDVDIANDLTISDGSFVLSTYTATIDGNCNINAIMDVGAAGNVLNHGLFEEGVSGTLNISGGSFINDHPYGSKAWQYLHGTLHLSAGLFEITHNSILLESTFNDFITGGTIRAGMSFRALTPGTFEQSGGNFEFTGAGTSGPYIDCPAGNYFNDLDINCPDDYVLYNNTEVRGNVTIGNGLLNFYSYDLSCLGNFNVNSGGSVKVNNGSTLKLDAGSNLTVAAGGQIQLIGTTGNESMVTHISSGSYSFSVYGTIGAQHAIFEFMDGNGLNVTTTGIVDPVYTFNNCRFQSGSPSPSKLFVLNNAQVFTCNDAYFENTFGNTQYNVWKYYNTGDVTFNNASGDFEGENFDYDPYNRVDWNYDTRTLDITIFLEGPYNSSTNNMGLGINSILPLNQPFDNLPLSNPIPDWYYTGIESVPAIPNPLIVDWVLLQLRDATSVATALPGTAISTQAAFLTSTGKIVGLDGVSFPTFTGSVINNLYAVVWTRNHLGVISANPLIDVGGYTYNFSTGSGQAQGGVDAQKLIDSSPVIWGMRSGDANGTGVVAIGDKTNVWSLQAGESGYLESDYNYNGQVENVDKDDYWLPNLGKGSFIPE